MNQAHYVARARPGRLPFDNDDVCRAVWVALRRAFPRALAAILMPDHLHVVAPEGGEARLSAVLRATSRQLGEGRSRLWDPVPNARPITSTDKVRRNVRYVWLNPCRRWRGAGGLVTDPLAWPWSSLRDVIGAIADPWTRAETVSAAFGWPHDPVRLHDYAMRDAHVVPAPFPHAPSPSRLPDRAVDDIFAAAMATTRSSPAMLARKTTTRRVAIGLAYRQGWTFPTRLAPVLGLRRSNSISRIAARTDPDAVEAAALCLHPRLLHPRRASIALRASA